jgi:S-adenosylmethionine:diacylglycerol 3-amino-3-carboxypropyl transferase
MNIEDDTLGVKIFFSQTREDPQIEISCANSTSKIMLIGSGGDTVCSLLVANMGQEIDVLDLNPDQLFLVKLKVFLVKNFDGTFVKKFLAGECSESEIEIVFENLHSDLKTYWTQDENFQLTVKGLNQIGRFEQLFKLASVDGFQKHFSTENLIQVFGESAVKYSMNRSFVEHFQNVLNTYRTIYKTPQENYFYNQFVNDCYEGDLPLYLSGTLPCKSNANITYYQSDLLTFFRTSTKKYDLVQLSNITDWLDPIIFSELLDLVLNSLEPNGKIILRRLNSDTILKDFLTSYEKSNLFEITDVTCQEKSHFYNEVIKITLVY